MVKIGGDVKQTPAHRRDGYATVWRAWGPSAHCQPQWKKALDTRGYLIECITPPGRLKNAHVKKIPHNLKKIIGNLNNFCTFYDDIYKNILQPTFLSVHLYQLTCYFFSY